MPHASHPYSGSVAWLWRQDSFFAALSNLQELREDVSVACNRVQILRSGIRSMEANMVSGTMKVPQLARRKGNLVRLQGLLEHVRTHSCPMLGTPSLAALESCSLLLRFPCCQEGME